MATLKSRFEEWRTSRTRGAKQITDSLGMIWMKEGYNELKKKLISIGRNNLWSDQIGIKLVAGQSVYTLPMGTSDSKPSSGYESFASVIQLEIGYELDKKTNLPIYHKAVQTPSEEFSDEKMAEIPTDRPRYEFLGKDQIVIFPEPTKTITDGIKLRYNYREEDIDTSSSESDLQMPFYLLDTLDAYLDYRLKRHETTRESAQIEYELWEKDISTALGMINNRDSRAVKEIFMDVRALE